MANPNRLRKYYTWEDAPVELGRGDDLNLPPESGEFQNTSIKPKVGQLVAVREGRSPRITFRVAKIASEDAQSGRFTLQWYGNDRDKSEGPWRPGWIESAQVGAKHGRRGNALKHSWNNKRSSGRATEYLSTRNVPPITVTAEQMICWGFRRRYDDNLPNDVTRAILADKDIRGDRQ